jgi:hypothetical protein
VIWVAKILQIANAELFFLFLHLIYSLGKNGLEEIFHRNADAGAVGGGRLHTKSEGP